MRIALAPGDGIGPEIMSATLDLFRAAGVERHVEFVPVEMGRDMFARGLTRGMTDEAMHTVEESGILFKGPMETPKGGGGKSINVTARKMWSAFANIRHFRTLPGVEAAGRRAGVNLDFTIVRENLEDTYGGIEQRLSDDTFQCKRIATAPGCDQVCHFAFQTARRMGLKKVHCAHKANIMKMTDGLFLNRFHEAAKSYPEIETGDVIVDALSMNLVMKPQQYQMVVMPNLQGDIVSDLAAGLVGGLGFAPSANIGRHISIFEAVHGTAPDIAGKGLANPTALILSGIMMLNHIGLQQQAATVENALLAALESGVHTGDFRGAGAGNAPAVGTSAFVAAIVAMLGHAPKTVPALAVTGTNTITHTRLPRPTALESVQSFARTAKQVVGIDIYIDQSPDLRSLVAELEQRAAGTPFHLVFMSNRGTQVWPSGSLYTECVDYWQARFELRKDANPAAVTQKDAMALLQAVASTRSVGSHELLRNFDGVRGYSLAQGQ